MTFILETIREYVKEVVTDEIEEVSELAKRT